MCIAGLVIGIIGVVTGIYGILDARGSSRKLREQTQWVHPMLVALKPAIQGPNRDQVIRAIDDMLERLQSPKPKAA
jgi:hypothetical protein